MRVKTSVTLPDDLLRRIDREDSNRSAFIERAARVYLARLERSRRDAEDAEIINRRAGQLNREAADVLKHQKLPGTMIY